MSRLRADKVLNKNATGPFEASEGIVIPEDKILIIGTNGGNTGEYLRRSSTGMTWRGIPTAADRLKNTTAPTAADDPGTAGEVRYDADYIYVCVATNTWKRVLIETWV